MGRERIRNGPDWKHSTSMKLETQEALVALAAAIYPGRVRRSVDICPVAVNHTIDNEEDAQETLRRMRATQKATA